MIDPTKITIPDRRLAVGSLVVAFAGALVGIAPFALGADMMTYGALVLVGPLVFFTGLAAAYIFWQRSRLLTRMVAGEDILANWTYEPAEWARFTEQEYRTEMSDRTSLLVLVAVLMVIIWTGLFFILPDHEAMVLVGYMLLAVLGLLIVVAVAIPWLQRRRNRSRPGEALLSRSGVWLAGSFHEWRSPGSRLESASIAPGNPPVIELTYSQLARYGRQDYTVRIPIPAGSTTEAETVVKQLQAVCGDSSDGPP